MADARDDAAPLALPAPLAIRWTAAGGDEDEEKESEANDGGSQQFEVRGHRLSGDSDRISKTRLKERPRAGSDGAATSMQQEADADDEEETEEERPPLKLKHRASPRCGQASSVAMRSPSRLAASLLVGRDRMARAARAWREGARRAGLFGAEEEDEDFDGEEDGGDEEEKTDSGFKRSSVSDPTASSSIPEHTASPDDPMQTLNLHDVDPAPTNESHVALIETAPRVASSLPLSVPRLIPSRLAPATRVPKMALLWGWLDRIECIAIRDVFTTHDDDDSGATVHYLLDVYNYQEQHSLPTHRYRGGTTTLRRPLVSHTSPTPLPLRKPDYHIQHRFSNFIKLRSRILQAAQLKHPNARAFHSDVNTTSSSHHRNCAYCRRLAFFIAAGNECVAPLGWRTKFFTTVEMRKTLLSQFVLELVFLAREQRDTCSNLATLARMPQPPSRHVHRSVPGILRRFLTVQTGENFMR